MIEESAILPGQSISIRNPAVDQLQIVVGEDLAPVAFEIAQNYPNPFNPATEIRFALPARELVQVKIFNSLGQRVKTLLNKTLDSGWHSVNWDASNDAGQRVGSGIYFYTVKAGAHRGLKKMMLLK